MANLYVRVLTTSGVPVVDAAVSVARSSVAVPELPMLTNEDGRATLVLPAGDFEIAAHHPDGGAATHTVHVEDDDQDLDPIQLSVRDQAPFGGEEGR